MPIGEYVLVTDQEFEQANAKKTKTIEITNFVDANEIESLYYETPYYIEPQESGARAYALLRDALKKTQKAGIATFVMRSKETLAILKARDNILLLRVHSKSSVRLPIKKSNRMHFSSL